MSDPEAQAGARQAVPLALAHRGHPRAAGAAGLACLHAAFLLYAWDGQGFSDVYEKVE